MKVFQTRELGAKAAAHPTPNIDWMTTHHHDRYAGIPRVANRNEDITGTDLLTRSIFHSLIPFQAAPSFHEAIGIFNMAIAEVISAVQQDVITKEEANALIGMLAEQLAHRQVDAAFIQLAKPMESAVSFGVEAK